MTTTPSSIFVRGYEALEHENVDDLRAALDEAKAAGIGDDDPRIGFLTFMSVWLDDDASEDELEQQVADAGDLLEAAAKLADPGEAAQIVFDLADMLTHAGEFDDAEHALRVLAERDDVDPVRRGAVFLLRASILFEHHEDPEETLDILDEAPDSLHEDPAYISLRAAALLELAREDEAIELLLAGLEHSDEVELRYQLGVALRDVEREDEALGHLLEVRRRDLATYEVDPSQPVDADEVEDLRRRVEDVLDTLPDPVISKVASAPIRVERWVSEDAVRAGADPRAPIVFLGEPGDDEDEGSVEALIVYRDAIVAQIDDDDEITDVIAFGLVEEFGRFFDLELIPGV